MMKLGGRFEFGGQPSPGCATAKNVVFGYDVGKISAGCLVVHEMVYARQTSTSVM